MSIRPTSFGVGETWTWNIRLRNVANAAVDADSTPTVTVYKNNSATGESVTVTKPSATTGWYQCSFDPAGEAEHDVYSFVENVTIASVAQAPFQWEAVVLASVGAGGLDAAGVRAAVGLASANMDTQLSGINNKTTNLPSDPADQSAVDGLIVAAVAAIRGADDDTLKTLSDQIDGIGSGGGGGSGDAEQATLLLVKAKTDLIGSAHANVALTAAAVIDIGSITGFPTTLTIGDSYDSNSGEIEVTILDADGDLLTAIGDLLLSDATIEFTAFRTGDPVSMHLVGTCSYAASIVSITLPSSVTSLGKADFTYEGRLKFTWSADDAQKTFKTTQFKFIENP